MPGLKHSYSFFLCASLSLSLTVSVFSVFLSLSLSLSLCLCLSPSLTSPSVLSLILSYTHTTLLTSLKILASLCSPQSSHMLPGALRDSSRWLNPWHTLTSPAPEIQGSFLKAIQPVLSFPQDIPHCSCKHVPGKHKIKTARYAWISVSLETTSTYGKMK